MSYFSHAFRKTIVMQKFLGTGGGLATVDLNPGDVLFLTQKPGRMN